MKQNTYLRILAIILAILLAVTLFQLWRLMIVGPRVDIRTVRDTIYRDTIIREPLAAETVRTGRTIFVPIPMPADTLRDTLRDTLIIPLPVTQRRYDDSLYTAWVSGYEPALDSIRILTPTITVETTRTVRLPPPRFAVGLQAGAGIGIIQHHPDIYVGVGITYRLWPK